jgi:hypothetical protein
VVRESFALVCFLGSCLLSGLCEAISSFGISGVYQPVCGTSKEVRALGVIGEKLFFPLFFLCGGL